MSRHVTGYHWVSKDDGFDHTWGCQGEDQTLDPIRLKVQSESVWTSFEFFQVFVAHEVFGVQELVAAALRLAFPHQFQPSRIAECDHPQAPEDGEIVATVGFWVMNAEWWMVRKCGNSFHITSFFRRPCSVLESSGPSAPPSLRENSSYDVLCWATDAIGNDIMQSMVMLPLPWADTRDQLQMLQVKLWFVTYDFQRLSSWNPLSAIDIEDYRGHGKEFVERGWKGHRMDYCWNLVTSCDLALCRVVSGKNVMTALVDYPGVRRLQDQDSQDSCPCIWMVEVHFLRSLGCSAPITNTPRVVHCNLRVKWC